MNKITKFAYLDFYSMKPFKSSLYMLILVIMIVGIAMKSVSMLSALFMMGLMIMMSFPFSLGEKNGLDTLYMTLPIRRKTIVIGRYFFALIIGIIGILFVLLLSVLLSTFFITDLNAFETYFMICVLFAAFSLIVSFQYPIFFKLGYSKGKILSKTPLFILFLVIMIWSSVGESLVPQSSLNTIWRFISARAYLMYGLPIGVGFLSLALSCVLSYRLYQNREL